jgi:hypothetical protein
MNEVIGNLSHRDQQVLYTQLYTPSFFYVDCKEVLVLPVGLTRSYRKAIMTKSRGEKEHVTRSLHR